MSQKVVPRNWDGLPAWVAFYRLNPSITSGHKTQAIDGYFPTCVGDLRVKPLYKRFMTGDKHWSPLTAVKERNPVAWVES